MAKNRKASRVGGPTKTPMYIIAGLSPDILNRVVSHYSGKFTSKATFIGLPSTKKDGHLYTESLITGLIRAVGGFTMRRRKSDDASPVNPHAIFLLYVPSAGSDLLISTFDFVVMVGALNTLAARNDKGHQLRHGFEAVINAIDQIIAPSAYLSNNLNIVRERISRCSDADGITLPPRNVHVENRVALHSRFTSMRNGALPWTYRFPELRLQRFTKTDLPGMPGQSIRHALVDIRNVAFFRAHESAEHGGVYEQEQSSETVTIQITLQSLYRFGVPITQGLHYDAQYADGSTFNRIRFFCCQLGDVTVSHSYANIYPNDFVRAKGKQKI